MEHSHLPGPRANIELAQAFAHIGTLMDFKKYIHLEVEEAPENSPEVFLVFCGLLGLGDYLGKYHDGGLVKELKQKANDERWQVREAVVMALQTIGRKNVLRLLKYAQKWAEGSFFEQRASVAGLCDPDLLQTRKVALAALELLDWVTANLVKHDEEMETAGYLALRKSLSYCWSIAVVAHPDKGKPMMERWIKEQHSIVRSVMRENIQKQQLQEAEPEWSNRWLEYMSS
ncbi:MAG: hypothetical protein U5J63_01760 [Fodinibius sp.]|nr:hypothetical protein [Fodinibius sp.]